MINANSGSQASHSLLLRAGEQEPKSMTTPYSALLRNRKGLRNELSGDRTRSQPQFRVLSQSVRLLILPDKLDDGQIETLYARAVALGALKASSIEFTNLILTALKAPKRVMLALKREQQRLSDDWIAKLTVLHIDWLEQTAKYGIMQDYAPYRVLPSPVKGEGSSIPTTSYDGFKHEGHESTTTPPRRPPMPRPRSSHTESGDDEQEPWHTKRAKRETSVESGSSQRSREREWSQESGSPLQASKSEVETPQSFQLLPPSSSSPQSSDCPPWRNSEFSCERPTPLISVHNQALVNELEVIRRQRALTSQTWSERSYSNCLSAIKAFPQPICDVNIKDVRNLKGVGQKMVGLVEQFCENAKRSKDGAGYIVEAQQIRGDPATEILAGFMELYGVGPVSARTLYEEGCRTFEDVIGKGKSLATQLDVADCYRILPDLETKIPRAEVEEIARLIHAEMESLLPGTFYQVCGGYRRGKSMSNDVDIVLSNCSPDFSHRLDFIDRMLKQLRRKGLMSYAVNVMGAGEAFETVGSIDVAQIVVLPPKSSIVLQPRHRRVDLIFCAPRIYGAAILGWTGSKTFEKDLRRWAQRKGYKFHSSGLRTRDDDRLVETPTELDVFRILQLPWMPPEYRNCDA
ncbi:unnamed protein product [Jaminaea pallidilutea]